MGNGVCPLVVNRKYNTTRSQVTGRLQTTAESGYSYILLDIFGGRYKICLTATNVLYKKTNKQMNKY